VNATKLSAQQREMLALIGAGRVTYGDSHPGRTARAVARGQSIVTASAPTFLIDGHVPYAGQWGTLAGLEERGLLAYEWSHGDPPTAVVPS
jgi:hypothetical protein